LSVMRAVLDFSHLLQLWSGIAVENAVLL
jgi:hypothetical protein